MVAVRLTAAVAQRCSEALQAVGAQGSIAVTAHHSDESYRHSFPQRPDHYDQVLVVACYVPAGSLNLKRSEAEHDVPSGAGAAGQRFEDARDWH